MTPEIQHLLTQYGYWLMAFGAIIEGETFLVAGGIAAHKGIFHLEGLIVLAMVGSTIHDVFFFLLGRFGGYGFVKHKPQMYAKVEGMLDTFQKYGVWLIIGLRYAYGLRTLIPTVLGMSHISFKKFLFFDLIGGFLWSCTFVLGGYFFGTLLDRFLDVFDIYSADTFYLIVAVAIVIFGAGFVFFQKRISRKKHKPHVTIATDQD